MSKHNTITRWIALLALAGSVMIFGSSFLAALGSDIGLWAKPDLRIGPGLPDWPSFALILFVMGMVGAYLANRDA